MFASPTFFASTASSASSASGSPATTIKPFKIALCQLQVTDNKTQNLENAKTEILKAAKNGAQLVVLPECFQSPYGNSYFQQYAEVIDQKSPSQTQKMLSQVAKQANVWIVGGSIPEKQQEQLFNTCLVYNSNGEFVTKFSKMHLFDINIPGQIVFYESKSLSAGNDVCVFESPFGRIGVGICFDIRFPNLAQIMAQDFKADMLVYPGAFNMTTGPKHWELLIRSRAVDNQIFVAACSPARVDPPAKKGDYVAYGHSTISDPWGEVSKTGTEQETLLYTVDPQITATVRSQINLSSCKRNDIYSSPHLFTKSVPE